MKRTILLAMAMAGGCARDGLPYDPAGAGPDLAQAASPDLAQAVDLAPAPDLSQVPDLADRCGVYPALNPPPKAAPGSDASNYNPLPWAEPSWGNGTDIADLTEDGIWLGTGIGGPPCPESQVTIYWRPGTGRGLASYRAAKWDGHDYTIAVPVRAEAVTPDVWRLFVRTPLPDKPTDVDSYAITWVRN